MIKKFFLLAAIAAVISSMSLVACGDSETEATGPSTPREYAKEKARLDKARNDASVAGDNGKLKELGAECEAIQKEIDAKCAEDKEFKDAFDKAYDIELENAMAQ